MVQVKFEVFLIWVGVLQQKTLHATPHCLLNKIGGKMKNPERFLLKNKRNIGS
ncbi:hypothetical protein ACFQ3K_08800 [Brucella gallinifaecis]|uniref:hypothetical protein n=1 Tax=Brucella gallinifaecis TaxID=215590 RepID=UPI00130D8A67|nr:hypothetical protein [Brucella gallinifaecis]